MGCSIPPFVGSAPYCYANAVAMALAARGERVDPGVVEALTLVGVGAAWEEAPGGPLIFFSGGGLPPDTGIDHALACLGWAFEARWTAELADDPEGAAALDALAELLRDGPVVLGPLDMGELAYLPGRADLVGADHYVLAYAIEDDAVRVHDPGGHPAVALALPALVAAWRAERVWYRRGGFGMWGRFRRAASPTLEEAARRSDETLGRLLREHGAGRAAWDELADVARAGTMSPALRGHLLWFALPVATRRALDMAALLRPLDSARATMQVAKASALGLAATALVADDPKGFADRVDEAAAAEEVFVAATLAVGVG